MNIQQRFSLSYAYDVVFSRDIFSPGNTTLLEHLTLTPSTRIAVFIDQGVADHHPGLTGKVTAFFSGQNLPIVHIVPGGEEAKNNPDHLKKVLEIINDGRIDRHSYVLAIGGGAVLDMVGFASAIAHRSVRHIRIPTTVLAQNDSGVGVKNGINYFGKKNFLGTFMPPQAVINDVTFLTTLEDRDWRSGISEAVKVALLKDADFYHWLLRHTEALRSRELSAMETLIRRCAELHVQHISGNGDPFEQGSSRPLDFGHWSAHKLEQLTGYAIRHGEAVALGIALDVCYATEAGLLKALRRDEILRLIRSLGFDLYHVLLMDGTRLNPGITAGLQEFREHLGGELTITLIRDIADAVDVHEMAPDLLDRAASVLKEYSADAN